MIRLPPTGIATSQDDLQCLLQHLDSYSGLLRQGFKKHEIIRYFRRRNPSTETFPIKTSSPLPPKSPSSTYDLVSRSNGTQLGSGSELLDSQAVDDAQQQFASPIRSPEPDMSLIGGQIGLRTTSLETNSTSREKTYAPRQSSLLRFARGMSSETSDAEELVSSPFSPRSSMTYRPRSQTYSYDQSENDEEDFTMEQVPPVRELQDLSLDGDHLTTGTKSTDVDLRTTSSLRPDAEPFMPSSGGFDEVNDAPQNAEGTSANSYRSSLPSSPPRTLHTSNNMEQRRLWTVELPCTQSPALGLSSLNTRDRQLQQQFLDGDPFTVYDESLPALSQPQTPADLRRSRHLTEYSAAYTAPPGMVRSSVIRQGINSDRRASGELSPAARAAMVRERRQREFVRGLRVEGLRIDRLRIETRQSAIHTRAQVDANEIWRDDLDADSVGEENFEETALTAASDGVRVVSGNRRAI